MFEKLILYSPIIILILSYILKFFWLRFSIFVDELISGDKIKYFSHILFWSIISYIYWVCHQYEILIFQTSDNNLDLVSLVSLVLTIWASYGVYIGFLQFMAGYDNKEKGTYLGYHKMDFLTKSNVWYHLTNCWEFFGSLLLSIVIPIIVKFNTSVDIRYQYLWQAIVGFLLILFIFLLKFSLKVVKITIFINKNTDGGLKEVIKSDIENRYNKYFNKLIKQKFSYGARESYFRQVKMDLSNIDNNTDKIIFLNVVYFANSSSKIIDKIEGYKEWDIVNYKSFIKEKYDLISHNNCEDDKLISFAISLFKLDVQIFDKLIKKDIRWIEIDNSFESIGITREKEVLGVEYNPKVRRLGINWYEYSKINNIHFCIFEILAEMAKNKLAISQLVNLIQERFSQNFSRGSYWETNNTDKLFVFEKSISDSSLLISKEDFKRIEKIDVFYSSTYPEIEFNYDTSNIYFLLHSNIIKIDFHFKNGGQYYVKRNEIRDYYNEYEEKVWNILFDKYSYSDDLSDVFLPNLREPEIILDSFGDRDEIVIRDYDNKLGYSRICFKYLTDNYDYVDSSTSNFTNLLEIVKTMSVNYRGAFALYQLLYPENRNWDSSVENYLEILSEVLSSRREERGKIYNDIVSIITEIEYGKGLDEKVLGKVFETKDIELIDDEFLKDFKGIPNLKLIVVQSILSTHTYGFRSIELQDRWEKQDLVEQYIRGLSITPNLFPSYTDDNKTLNSSMSEFLLKNMELLTSYDFGKLPLSSLLLFEKLLHRKWWGDNKHDEQEFMVNLIKEKVEYRLSGYRYNLDRSLLKFFTLKLTEGQGNQYLRIVNEKDFKKEFKFSLLNHLKRNQLTLDMYLDGITDELKKYDCIMIGIYERELIKREVEKIIFSNYFSLE
ncbi:membrane protein [Streptococcus agalactiae]|nr:membrane protein [Streptococcus agalactiae]CNG24141.1 membrane protein [Streptococcus agalactiae]